MLSRLIFWWYRTLRSLVLQNGYLTCESHDGAYALEYANIEYEEEPRHDVQRMFLPWCEVQDWGNLHICVLNRWTLVVKEPRPKFV